ncbi:MAG TPA: MFS transporter [Solirubrobacteraceae bacterium]
MRLNLRVLRHLDFRFLFLGQSASAVGDQVVIVALALYVTQRTGSATDLGFILAAQSLPMVALLLFGGVWADRRGGQGRRRIMLGSDLARAGLHGGLALLILSGGASVPAMVLIEMAFGAARAFFQPAYSGLLPETIPEAEIQEARALTQSTANLAIVVGPALGTVLIVGVGAGAAFALDAASFLLSALLLTRVSPRQRGAVSGTEAPLSTLRSLREGWGEVRSRPWVWVTIAAFTGIMLTGYAQWYSLAPSIARSVYGRASVFGVLESVAGVGAVIGALTALRWRPRRPLAVGLMLGFGWITQSILFALAAPLGVVVAAALAGGFGFSLFGIWWETALAHHIPPRVLSRVSAYDWMGSLALLPLGFAVAGPLAEAFGARPVLAAGAVFSLLMLSLALLPRSTRELSGRPSAQQVGGDVAEERGREAEVAHVDPLVGVVHQRRGLE